MDLFDVVKKVRNAIRIKKVGHAGTLDPLATGLLILCTGRATKTIEGIQGDQGVHRDHQIWATTASYDAELPEENIQNVSGLTQEQIEAELSKFRGEVTQVPPICSAVKVDGKRAYEQARKGKEVKLKERTVQIYSFELIEAVEPPHTWKACIECSKGTYIRSLAHDLGQALGVGAYLTGLVRTRIGDYLLSDAWELEELVEEIRQLRNAEEENQDLSYRPHSELINSGSPFRLPSS